MTITVIIFIIISDVVYLFSKGVLGPIFPCSVGFNILKNIFQMYLFSSNLRKMTSLLKIGKIFS